MIFSLSLEDNSWASLRQMSMYHYESGSIDKLIVWSDIRSGTSDLQIFLQIKIIDWTDDITMSALLA